MKLCHRVTREFYDQKEVLRDPAVGYAMGRGPQYVRRDTWWHRHEMGGTYLGGYVATVVLVPRRKKNAAAPSQLLQVVWLSLP